MKAVMRLAVVAVAIAGLAATANAGLIAGTIPAGGVNDLLGVLPGTTAGVPVGGYYGAQLGLVGGPADITVEWYGGEAGYHNEFYWDGSLLFTHPGGNNGQSTPVDSDTESGVASGLLPFSFFVPDTSLWVVNGTNPDNTGTGPNFFVSFDLTNTSDGGPMAGQAVWLFFDDGGAANDDNHDDMVIRLAIKSGEFRVVPEPGSIFLIGSGLVALWAGRRRRS